MANKKNSRRALFTSIISLILCCAMLMGTTFAWFTDSVTSGTNRINAGNLDVELYHSNKDAKNVRVNDQTILFDTVERWEPGAMVYENFEVKNVGDLALKYQLALTFEGAETVNGKTLADVLKVAVVPNGFNPVRDEAEALDYDYTLSTFSKTGALEGKRGDKVNSDTYGIVIYWPHGPNDNDFNMNNGETKVLSIDLGVVLHATQVQSEEDSFGSLYDEGLKLPVMTSEVHDVPSFAQALKEGNKVVLMNDLVLQEDVVVPVGVTAAIDFNGHSVTSINGAKIVVEGNLILLGESNGAEMIDAMEELPIAVPVSYAVKGNGILQIDGAQLEAAPDAAAITVSENGAVIMNSGLIIAHEGSTCIALVNTTDAKIALNGGNVGGEGVGIDANNSVADVYTGNDVLVGEVNIAVTGGNLDLTYAGTKPIISGDSNLVETKKDTGAEGLYQDSEDPNVYYVDSKAGLMNLKTLPFNTGEKYRTINLRTDIDMSGEKWTALDLMFFTFDGHGHTISNLNVVESGNKAGFFGYVGGGTIQNLTLKNVTATGSQVGVFAGQVEGGKILDCTIEGTNVLTWDDHSGDEITKNGVGAFVGVSVETNTTNGTIASGATVTMNKGQMAPAWDKNNDYVGGLYTATQNIDVTNNGQIITTGYKPLADGLMKKLGTSENEYIVTSAAGLSNLNSKFADRSLGRAVVVNLANDIDFSDYTWTPVGSHVDSNCYLKEINGNGHTISNLTINGQAMFTRFAGSGDVAIRDITFDNANVNSNGTINTSILTVQTYQNVLLDNVDVMNSTIIGGYKVAPLIATVYNENPSSTITATLKNCDVENVTVKATSYDFCTTGMVAFVNADDNDKIEFENCTITDVKLYAPNVYTAHAAVYTTGSETLFNVVEGVSVSDVTFENI